MPVSTRGRALGSPPNWMLHDTRRAQEQEHPGIHAAGGVCAPPPLPGLLLWATLPFLALPSFALVVEEQARLDQRAICDDPLQLAAKGDPSLCHMHKREEGVNLIQTRVDRKLKAHRLYATSRQGKASVGLGCHESRGKASSCEVDGAAARNEEPDRV
eukprot:CAMPEP_0181211772 /NCGR_PEP_ID=MMETSP1096-20121128/23978_1 /TAXON_ID=156174 ORGANISM="Chrysochromulina ericina, Strain CCMP281" /NCGR_SAMPLE_ID=MMETSP1096 /ASSEMBLY_ACC=CAM_ASM_000453 /LENGTH=157 /DNA_ID=CAMNT_0023303223 /DNA_START=317 /DNA_END=791 /DNA_ORIENTATION=+